MSKYRTEEKGVVVIGGCSTALELADAGISVELYEAMDELLSATSANTPGRMGLGFHCLSDADTAEMYLKATIEFARKYPGFMIGEGEPESQHLLKGRYFVTPDSFVSPDIVLERIKGLQKAYADLVEKDPLNAVFGPPESFYRELKPSEYAADVNGEKVSLAIETQEALLDWPKFRQHLLDRIEAHPNITVRKKHKVSNVTYNREGAGFVLTDQISGNQVETGYVVNATWQNIEALNDKMGFNRPSEQRTNRLKLLVDLELPEAMQEKHSMFFCLGPHCMFSNMGNGRGRITYAPVTNHDSSTDLELPQQFADWLEKGLSEEETDFYGKNS